MHERTTCGIINSLHLRPDNGAAADTVVMLFADPPCGLLAIYRRYFNFIQET